MSRTAYKFSAVIVSLSLAAMLAGCGSSNKEGTTNPAAVARVADEATCRHCHAATLDPVSGTGIAADFLTATNSHNQLGRVDGPNADLGCQGCHGGGIQHNGVGPIPFSNPLESNRCITCHTASGLAPTTKDLTPLFELAKVANGGWVANSCAHCHTSSGVGSIHGAMVPETNDCVFCHAVAAPNHGADLVNDNSGVRAVTTEFAKWSHHVTGVTLNAAHCAACHLEGTVVNGVVVVDQTKHMTDATVHLRNADTDADLAWDPAAPNHTDMDNFCMSCHDANGATSPMSNRIQIFINANGLRAAGKIASASNPFGDTISNRYDKMQRPAVVDASSQFNTGNNSHHAVKGPRYTKRTRIADASDPRAMTAAQSVAFAANSSALLKGKRSTIYDAKVVLPNGSAVSVLNQLYVPLENAGGEVAPRTGSDTLGDDSTLHCGDCHTVGQWKVGSSVDNLGKPTTAAIGAHGSNNEYLLRNSIGTDQRHTQNAYTLVAGIVTFTNPNGAFLVCYNCHAYAQYGSVYNATGVAGPHAGEYDQAGRCDGVGNTIPFNGYTTGTATDGTQFASRFEGPVTRFAAVPAFAPGFPLIGIAPATGEQNPDFGDIFGIQCLNCHNSGVGNAYGGIHGSFRNTDTVNATVAGITAAAGVPVVTGGAYIDGMGNVNKVERFLPGLGDAMHVPGVLGGFIGGVTVNSTTATPYPYTTGAVSRDTNWEQKHWQQTATTNFGPSGQGPVTGTLTSAGAGCYTLGENADAATSALRGPSVTGAGGAATTVIGTWGGCDDHNAAQGNGDHGFVKRIVRPLTY